MRTCPVKTTTDFTGTCSICSKVYTQEHSFNRHVKYCQRAQSKRKGRPKACLACCSSKVKCTFTKPQCSRCKAKGLDCVYEPTTSHPVATKVPSFAENEPLHLDPSLSRPVNESTQGIMIRRGAWPPSDFDLDDDFSTQNIEPNVTIALDGFSLEPKKCDSGAYHSWAAYQTDMNSPWQSMLEPSTPHTQSYSSDDIISLARSTTTLVHLRYGNPATKYAANLISNMFSAFPQMMLRRQTFPPFIHPHWHRPTLPDKLATCMSIAQLFAARTPETMPFLWRTIEAEERRIYDEIFTMNVREIQTAIQAILIYIIMVISCSHHEDPPERGERMIQTFIVLCLRTINLLPGEWFANTEQTHPSATWEDWIFAESRRRITSLCFVISRVVSFRNSVPCTTDDIMTKTPLISSKTLWEARTREEWEIEKVFYEASCPMQKFGELVEARANSADPQNAQKLENWEAGADKMAQILNIATVFV